MVNANPELQCCLAAMNLEAVQCWSMHSISVQLVPLTSSVAVGVKTQFFFWTVLNLGTWNGR